MGSRDTATTAGSALEISRWTPRDQPGGIYCSPACGGRCTRAAYERATREADALAARMGAEWSPHVWENLGWHYSAVCGVTAIHPSKDYSTDPPTVSLYTVYFNSAKQVVTQASTPEDALGFAVQDAHTIIRRIANDLAALSAGKRTPPEQNRPVVTDPGTNP